VRFTAEEIELAHQLKAAKLDWTPQVGHFVWDGEALIEQSSPFHDRVFFILDLKHFLRRSGTMQRLAESMVWLPTWSQLRECLRRQGVSDEQVDQYLRRTDAIRQGTEREQLYRLLLTAL